jgi:acrylyl-CoA reductase (NADPH)
VNLLGIDTVLCPPDERQEAWARLARDLPMATLDALTSTIPLGALPELSRHILAGGVRGRIVVDLYA